MDTSSTMETPPTDLYNEALHLLVGHGVARDLTVARSRLRMAAEQRHPDAGLLEVALTANGSGGPQDWSKALKRLKQLSRTDPRVKEHLKLLSAMSLDDNGRPRTPPQREPIAQTLRLTRFPALLSRAECEHLARSSANLLEPAIIVDPGTRRSVTNPVRTSDAAVIGPGREDLVIRAINLRIAAATDTAVEQGEPLSILRYRPGQQYKLHSDALPGVFNQRVQTVLVYLNDAFTGGETEFPAAGVLIRPRAGDAIAFTSVRKDGSVDPASQHIGRAVIAGVKWLATRWIRAGPFDPWTPTGQ